MRYLLFFALSAGLFSQPPEMRFYVFAILEKGPKWTPEVTPESQELQKGHMANIQKLAAEKKLLLAGPLGQEAGDMRGIFVFDTDKIEDAKEWCDEDPAVKAGRLKVRLMRWYSVKGVGVHTPPAQ
ncbi:MAG: hypothetical protein FJW30_26005 [Acidobacteria bacterium]|nr:hypothetical protein [Acidobacteriota bacterium]